MENERMSIDHEILKIIEECAWKGKYVSAIKNAGYWPAIMQRVSLPDIKDTERVFRFLNPTLTDYCRGNKKLNFNSLSTGFKKYCNDHTCSYCKEDRKTAAKNGVIAKYGVDNVGKLDSAIKNRNNFWNNPEAVASANDKRRMTNIEKYGVGCVFQSGEIQDKIKTTMLEKYGVENPSQSEFFQERKRETCILNHGVEYGPQSVEVREKAKETNLRKYGVPFAMQNPTVKDRTMQSKIENGSFTQSNSSLEATLYFREYIKSKSYDMSQVSYADAEFGLHEWGYYFDRWYLYDFVAFEMGHRGNPKKIIEMIEYHGPFHYKEDDVLTRGQDKAYPWPSNTMTIAQSYEKDYKKEAFAKTHLTSNYTIIWSPKWH